MTDPDIIVKMTPSFVLIEPKTERGADWMDTHLTRMTERWSAEPVEYRYIEDIVLGARKDGMVVETDGQHNNQVCEQAVSH